ncbi:type III secretion system inner membrane ring subunit SctD [Caballeronia sp. EK]|uniref:type III secretion system inner membrane ring subunit SctD n=1 Tax=Caballeronia sp. EK TaxID=2767469 RepID=UPI0016557FA8|nr:type III secretion system inner membrane ring subunit SctD [Caballeronia sp. EK]MBC8642807.1 type III secretion system inner membrane ring subunit SctD [Caballeronia sp. EK]
MARDLVARVQRSHPELGARWLDDGTLVLSGRCRNSEQLGSAIEQLRSQGVRIQQMAVCDDELERSVRALLADYGYSNASVTLTDGDHIYIDGPVRDDKLFPVLVEALDKMPGLRDWQLSDGRASELAELLARLRAANLLGGISAIRSEQGWVLSGQLDPVRQTALEHVVALWNAEPGRATSLRFVSVASIVHAADYLPAAISSISGNADEPFLELANGTRLQPGSAVLGGMRIVDINPTGISLTNDHRLLFLSSQR